MSQGSLCPNLTKKVQKEVSQMANRNLPCDPIRWFKCKLKPPNKRELRSVARTSALDFGQERLCKTDLSGLKLSVSIANPCSKLLCTEVKGLYQAVRKQTLYI